MGRSPIVALIMMVIPIVNFYLLYKWWEEYKAMSGEDYNPIMRLILCLIPIVNLYFLWKLFTGVEAVAKKKNKGEYPLGATVLYIVGLVTFGLGLLYMTYRTQELMNACE